jgi:hypothetical protein
MDALQDPTSPKAKHNCLLSPPYESSSPPKMQNGTSDRTIRIVSNPTKIKDQDFIGSAISKNNLGKTSNGKVSNGLKTSLNGDATKLHEIQRFGLDDYDVQSNRSYSDNGSHYLELEQDIHSSSESRAFEKSFTSHSDTSSIDRENSSMKKSVPYIHSFTYSK